ncbi:MAG: hypothetical protein CVV49_00755 [Spirochaetae bacterium HGW-Spirochaetae-5]|nr:MAG: hypothetical protein CVV49_00755 [Spirochaetae bacterium HGW-Spirochaetae-5]
MSNTISNKAMIFTDYDNLFSLAAGIMPAINVVPYTDGESLSSLSCLKKRIISEKNISFLKKDILAFIQNNGYPFITIIDMKIDSGLDNDHDRMRIFKTFLLSYIIIMQSEQYKNISCNLLILMNKNEFIQFKESLKHPQNIMSLLKTNDERLNSIINEYKVNNEKFKKNFNILVTDAEQELSLIRSEFILFINMIKAKEKLKNKLMNEKPTSSAGPKISAAEPADVALRTGKLYFRNGSPASVYDEKLNLTEKEIYISGNFTSYTRLDVIERLMSLIKAGFGNDFILRKGDTITINIPKESVIDSTTPITIAQLISKELNDYKSVRIKTNAVHYQLMQQSQGFSMIQRNVIIHED